MKELFDTTSLKIRRATINDVPALAALHVVTFNETHGLTQNVPTFGMRAYQWQYAFANDDGSWFCFVIEKENRELVGFAKGLPYHHEEHAEYSGELNKIYLLKKYQRMGLGLRLVCKVASEFIDRKIFSMLLFGDAANPSNQFYEALGAERLVTKNGDFHGGYGWKDLKKLVEKYCR